MAILEWRRLLCVVPLSHVSRVHIGVSWSFAVSCFLGFAHIFFAYLVASVALLLLFLPLFIAVSQQPKGSFMYVILLSEAVN
ncbi:hypothetical protein [uncultured Prevotella sp.]|uniref:hypothetical protein n=1 Tax=uncultured Prevotella sp. TaxID=159272 RepID=UPI0025FBCE81|nr:hypothetical protein [uncultured Prevotella sp.]